MDISNKGSIIDRYLAYFRELNEVYAHNNGANIMNINLDDESKVLETFMSLDWSFSGEDTTYLSHDIHPYPAKFPPQIPAHIINMLSSFGETIWDPFGGSGTTALEAIINNRKCISTDINPIGGIIGKAKTTGLSAVDEQEMDHFIARLEYYDCNKNSLCEYFHSHKNVLNMEIPDIPNIEKWFEETVICELAFIKSIIKNELKSQTNNNIARASLSKIVTKLSNQENETTYRAIKRQTFIGETVSSFLKDLRANYEKIKDLSSIIGYKSCEFVTANVMEELVGKDNLIKNNSVDLVVTSPPYPNAFDYHLYHRFRIFWLDGDPREMGKVEIGSHLKYQKSNYDFEQFKIEMRPVLENCYRALKAGRYAVFVLGNALFNGVEYETAELIGKVAEEIGFKIIGIIDRQLPETKRTVKSWARRATTEQMLILRKPSSNNFISLKPVEYRLWPYEKVISDLERKALTHSDKDDFETADIEILKKIKKLTFYKGYTINDSEFETWQRILEHGADDDISERKDPKFLTHGIHPYKGKFYPQLVRPLLNILGIEQGGCVFDPFCGSGTVPLEAILNGYDAFGCDINPVAIEIGKAKNSIFKVSSYDFEKQITMFEKELQNYEEVEPEGIFDKDAMEEIKSWFPEKVIAKMAFILQKIQIVPDERIRRFLKVILSSIIREISQQDPSDLRIRRRKEPIDDASVIEMYLENLDKQNQNIMTYFHICNNAPEKIGESKIWRGNSTNVEEVKKNIGDKKIDIVITSPPYATALPYIDTNRLNMLVLDGINASRRVPIEAEMTGTREINKSTRILYEEKIKKSDFDAITSDCAKDIIKTIYNQNKNADVGFRRKNMAALIYMYFRDMSMVLNTLNEIVKDTGYVCLVIGDTKTTTGEKEVVIKTTEMLRETGRNLGWNLIEDIPISVTVENYKHMKKSITENNILIFQK